MILKNSTYKDEAIETTMYPYYNGQKKKTQNNSNYNNWLKNDFFFFFKLKKKKKRKKKKRDRKLGPTHGDCKTAELVYIQNCLCISLWNDSIVWIKSSQMSKIPPMAYM